MLKIRKRAINKLDNSKIRAMRLFIASLQDLQIRFNLNSVLQVRFWPPPEYSYICEVNRP